MDQNGDRTRGLQRGIKVLHRHPLEIPRRPTLHGINQHLYLRHPDNLILLPEDPPARRRITAELGTTDVTVRNASRIMRLHLDPRALERGTYGFRGVERSNTVVSLLGGFRRRWNPAAEQMLDVLRVLVEKSGELKSPLL